MKKIVVILALILAGCSPHYKVKPDPDCPGGYIITEPWDRGEAPIQQVLPFLKPKSEKN